MNNSNNYYCYNGAFYKKNVNVIDVNNRLLNYGDGFFETIFVSKKKVMFLDKHYDRILFSATKLRIEIPDFFTKNYLEQKIIELLNRNKSFVGTRIKLLIFRDSKGLYMPENNKMSFVIDSVSTENTKYVFNKKGFMLDTFEIKKPVNKISNLKTTNALLNVLAGINKKDKNVDDLIILNQDGFVCEGISSNIFIVKDKIIYTPTLEDGCVKGIMRENVIDVAIKNKFVVIDEAHISISDVENADEVFLTNSIWGIRWVMGFRNKRYYNTVSKKLINEINEIYF